MKVSLEWISQYVDIKGIDPEVIADKITMGCAEVEGIIEVKRAVENVFAAEITKLEPVEGSKKLQWATVDCGGKQYLSACGAPNPVVGMKTLFAAEGAVLAEDFKVGEREIAGKVSQGMLCSAKELGFSDFHEGIFELPAGIANGTPLKDLVPASDTLLDIDNKSLTHRPDLWGQYGFAREFAAIFGKALKPMNLEDLSKYASLPEYKVAIEDLENCPAYSCIEMGAIKPEASPLFIQWRLHSLGQRSINLLVDLTNYIMFEIGQPTHAFDGDKLKEIRVAPFEGEGSFYTLDENERKMLPEDLMIWNEKEPVALAGVMGGLNSEVTESTTKLLLESANFKGARIRRTAGRLNMHSEASMRFEKSQPPVNAKIAIQRFISLLHESGITPEILTRFSFAGDLKEEFRPLEFSMELFNKRTGMILPEKQVLGILQSLGFHAMIDGKNIKLGIPPYRSMADVSIPVDIVEEVARIYGYDNIEPEMPKSSNTPVEPNIALQQKHKCRKYLAASRNFMEIQTYAWYDDKWLDELGFDPGDTLVLKNPTAPNLSRMKTEILPNLLATVGSNMTYRDSFQVFEIADVYRPLGDSDREETSWLGGISFRQSKGKDLEEHFGEVKGAIEGLMGLLTFKEASFELCEETVNAWKYSKNYLNIMIDGKKVGSLGVLPRSTAEKIGKNVQVIWFELHFAALDGGIIYPELTYKNFSIYPGSWQDFSVLWKTSDGFAGLDAKLQEFSHPLLKNREFLCLYSGPGVEEGLGSYSFRFSIGSDEKTLSGEEIDGFKEAFIGFLHKNGLSLRT